MWQRFTERARRVVFFAQEEAGKLGENYVSTEHLLFGLTREPYCVAAQVLTLMDVGLGRVRSELDLQVARGDAEPGQDMQLTPRAKSVIDFAYDEARQFNNNYIGTEHLLLGMLREEEGLAGRVLISLGVELERTRREVAAIQAERRAASTNTSADDPESAALPLPPAPPIPLITPGDLGRLVSPEGRSGVEVAVDAAAVRELRDVFLAGDGYGYQELLDLGRVFVAATNESVKYLVAPRESSTEPAPNSSFFVRILEGVHEGRKGWIAADAFERTGPDETPFPPEESSLSIDPDDMIP